MSRCPGGGLPVTEPPAVLEAIDRGGVRPVLPSLAWRTSICPHRYRSVGVVQGDGLATAQAGGAIRSKRIFMVARSVAGPPGRAASRCPQSCAASGETMCWTESYGRVKPGKDSNDAALFTPDAVWASD